MVKRQSTSKQLLHKKQILDQTQEQLKTEFIGIDKVINETMDAISSWYLFPELQDKPVVINLWGLTGVGKSSLVNRLAESICFSEKYYHFDLGAKNDEWSIQGKLSKIYEHANGFPIILALDEFQHARTIDEAGKEVDKYFSRVVWELLDNGKFQITRYNYHVSEIYDLIYKLRHMLLNGVVVQKGKVVRNKNFFLKEINEGRSGRGRSGAAEIQFVPEHFQAAIYESAREKFKSVYDVKEKLSQLSGNGTVDFLQYILQFINSPKTIDCSKALVFVLGNLDEAYRMSNDFNPDIFADEFHEQSLKINISQIKRALKVRFRSEQIARLGNTHIIYPAFSSDSFKKIIRLELFNITERVKKLKKIPLAFDESIVEMIYGEGVFPTQGTRPIFTTIHQVINTKLGRIFTEMFLHKLHASSIYFRAEKDFITVEFLLNDKIIHSFSVKQILNLEALRKSKRDDVQAITAVHEVGHAVLAVMLLRILPEIICSTTAEYGTNGFVSTKIKWKYISKKEILPRLAVFLGGLAAEKMVFGDEHVTTGCEDDLVRATEFISEMLKESGMGEVAAAIHVKDCITRHFLHDEKNEVNDEIEKWLIKARTLAEKTLLEQETLLLKMANHLSDHRSMTKDLIKSFLVKYAYNFDESDLIENGDDLYYRRELKRKVVALEEIPVREIEIDNFEFSLNKSFSQ
ncbi:MAG: hypothetical protein LH473_03030 [Chitinophagales bacterium]|nr:hypothetical protein [Chitinophagales bacterium]